MEVHKMRELGPGYTSEIDTVDEKTWSHILQEFDDANIYQTWPYGAVTSGGRNVSRLILRQNGDVAAVSQARIAKLPFINVGIAYVGWGPLWRRAATEANVEIFRQAVRALRNEFVCKRGLVLRLFPSLVDDDSPCFSAILVDEAFSPAKEPRGRTILMDLSRPLENLRQGMGRNWKRNLKSAEQSGLEVVEGSGEELFETFIGVYKEMVSRKRFVEPNDINQFKLIQAQLPEKLKMNIMLCRSREGVCAGLVWSAIGKTGIELFAATSNAGNKTGGSHLLRWKLIEKLKQNRFGVYNLNGINPVRNPGTYRFKAELAGENGRDVHYLGRFDAYSSFLKYSCVGCGDTVRTVYRKSKGLAARVRCIKLWPKLAN